jgi:serine/threonine protein phosphatase 1
MAGMHFLDARGPEGMRLYAIGDVHGRLDLLKAMHSRIRAELMRDHPQDWRIIHVGDYVDRGPDSKGVLDFLIERIAEDPRVIALRGNHDEGFEHFLTGRPRARTFTHNGGDATCQSYGVTADFSSTSAIEGTRIAMESAVPAAHLGFLEGLKACAEFGDLFFCHAGIRPGVPLDRQDPQDLIWIRNAFLDHPEPHPKVIVHGHTPQNEAEVLANRVNIDTLAYASGRLTALVVDGSEKRLLEVSA